MLLPAVDRQLTCGRQVSRHTNGFASEVLVLFMAVVGYAVYATFLHRPLAGHAQLVGYKQGLPGWQAVTSQAYLHSSSPIAVLWSTLG